MQILNNATQEEIETAYCDLKDLLTDEKKQNTLVIHVLSGHALQNKTSKKATFFTNEWNQSTQHYKRFSGEAIIAS